jgi:hypothetical protein
MKYIIPCLWLGFLAAAPLSGQDEGGSGAKQAKGRLAWFIYTSVPEGLENPVSVMSGTTITQVVLSKLSPSDSVKIPADGIIRIVRKVENPKDPEKPEYLTLAKASVPEGVSNALVILMPVAKNPSGLLFQTKVQDLASFRGGDSVFLNMTKLKIGVELGKAKIQIDPGQMKVHNPLEGSQSVSLPIRLSYFHPERDKWNMITASTVALYSTRREMCIFNWDANFNRVDFESITLPTAN